MATPVGHCVAGYAVFAGRRRAGRTGPQRQVLLLALCLFLANLADLDFVPGVLAGTPALYHQGPTHSIAAAGAASLAAATAHSAFGRPFWSVFGLGLAAYGSHLAIDLLGRDGTPPFGLPLLWPASETRVLSPAPIFLGVRHAPAGTERTSQWIRNILSVRNLAAVGLEVALLAPAVLLARLRRRRGHSDADGQRRKRATRRR